jgi:hypothetical protein
MLSLPANFAPPPMMAAGVNTAVDADGLFLYAVASAGIPPVSVNDSTRVCEASKLPGMSAAAGASGLP